MDISMDIHIRGKPEDSILACVQVRHRILCMCVLVIHTHTQGYDVVPARTDHQHRSYWKLSKLSELPCRSTSHNIPSAYRKCTCYTCSVCNGWGLYRQSCQRLKTRTRSPKEVVAPAARRLRLIHHRRPVDRSLLRALYCSAGQA